MPELPPTLQRAVEIAETFRCPFVKYEGHESVWAGPGGILSSARLNFSCDNGRKVESLHGYVSIVIQPLHIDEYVKSEIRRVCRNMLAHTITFGAESPQQPENEPDGKGEGDGQ